MAEPSATVSPSGQSIFISYSRADKRRVTGLGLLLEALGHQVFIDHKTILPGAQWQMKLQEGLEQAEVLLVFWTKHSADSDWVRKEYEYFFTHHPERMLVPVVGDETPLNELLKKHQRSDFSPLINELLEMKRSMEKTGVKPPEIQKAVIERLREAGIDLTERQKKKLLRLFAPTGFLGLLTTPIALFQWGTNTGLEAIAQFSAAQLIIVGVAAISGAVVCGVVDHFGEADQTVLIENSTQNNQSGKKTVPGTIKEENEIPTVEPRGGTPDKFVPQGMNRGKTIEPNIQTAPSRSGSNDCAQIDCDCNNLDFGLLTGPFRQECRAAEAQLKTNCAKTGKVIGTCHPTAPGPNPWPK